MKKETISGNAFNITTENSTTTTTNKQGEKSSSNSSIGVVQSAKAGAIIVIEGKVEGKVNNNPDINFPEYDSMASDATRVEQDIPPEFR